MSSSQATHVVRAAAFAVLLISTWLIVSEARRMEVWPIDSYFYLAKAESLVRGHGLSVPWSDQPDAKYFPGYSLALAVARVVCAFQPWYWLALQVALLWLSALLLQEVAKHITGSPSLAWGAAAIWAAHPQVIKWTTVPMGETLAVTLALASVATYLSGRRRPRSLAALGAGLSAGLAISTRIEMFALTGALALHWLLRRRISSPRWIAWGAGGLLLGLSPAIVWFISQHAAAVGTRPNYVNYFFANGPQEHWWQNIMASLFYLAYLQTVPAQNEVIDRWLFTLYLGLMMSLALALAGWLRRWGLAVALLLLTYVIIHCLWPYFSDRFLLPVVPFAAPLWVGGGRAWLMTPSGERSRGVRRAIGVMLLLPALAVWLWHGQRLQIDHRLNLTRDEPWRPAHLAALIHHLLPENAAVITDLGPALAYHLDRPMLFDRSLEHYYEATMDRVDALQVIRDYGVGAVATRLSVEEWLTEAQIPRSLWICFPRAETGSMATLMLVDQARLAP